MSGLRPSLSGADKVRAQYTAPQVTSKQRSIWRLTVVDDDGASATGLTVVNVIPATVTPTMYVTPGTTPITEGEDAWFTVISDTVVASDVTVEVTFSQDGDFWAFSRGRQDVQIRAGRSTYQGRVFTVDDLIDEPDGWIQAVLSPGSSTGGQYQRGTPHTARVVVEDNDGTVTPPPVVVANCPGGEHRDGGVGCVSRASCADPEMQQLRGTASVLHSHRRQRSHQHETPQTVVRLPERRAPRLRRGGVSRPSDACPEMHQHGRHPVVSGDLRYRSHMGKCRRSGVCVRRR